MTEILPPGSKAETCGMPAGSGMNGVKGYIISYNASTGRYTFESDNGDGDGDGDVAAGSILSLRARNLRALHVDNSDDGYNDDDHDDEFVTVETVHNEDGSHGDDDDEKESRQ